MHSPFGIIGKLRRDLHLSLREILWGESWIELVLEAADQPGYRSRPAAKPEPVDVDELREILPGTPL